MQKLGIFFSAAHRSCLDTSSPAFEEVQKLSVSLGQLKDAWIQTGLQTQKGTPIVPILHNWGLTGYKQEFRLKKVHQLYPSWTTGGCLVTNRNSDSKRYTNCTHPGQLGVAWLQTRLQTQKGTPIVPILDNWGLTGYKQEFRLKKVHQFYPSWTTEGCPDTNRNSDSKRYTNFTHPGQLGVAWIQVC